MTKIDNYRFFFELSIHKLARAIMAMIFMKMLTGLLCVHVYKFVHKTYFGRSISFFYI